MANSTKMEFTVTVVMSHVEESQEAIPLHLHPSPSRDGSVNIELRSSVLETVDTVVVTQID